MKDEIVGGYELDILSRDGAIFPLRLELNIITGDINSTLLLTQILYWRKKYSGNRFYKFKQPCKHEKYKKGDSWCEELYMTPDKFDSAIKRIGFKMGKTKNKLTKETALIWYYKTSEQLTYYEVNVKYLRSQVRKLYAELSD